MTKAYLSIKEDGVRMQKYAMDNGVAVVSDKFYDGFNIDVPENCMTFSQVRERLKKETLNKKLKKIKNV